MNQEKLKQWYPNSSEKDLHLLGRCKTPEKVMPPEEVPEFVWIPEGQFVMGDIFRNSSIKGEGQDDERPLRLLNLQGFWIAENVVTNQEYRKFIETASPDQNAEFLEQIKEFPEDRPVHSVTWDEADAYCKWREAQTPGKHVCLPTEAQWEKAAGWHLIGADFEVGRKYEFATGDDVNHEHTVFNRATLEKDASSGNGLISTDFPREISKLAKGVNGLKGASGNVWEWCKDFYQYEFYERSPDGTYNDLDLDSKRRVLRGGSWANVKRRLRTSNRLGSSPSTRNDNFGFRLVMKPLTTGKTE